jgi:hypothetical protein
MAIGASASVYSVMGIIVAVTVVAIRGQCLLELVPGVARLTLETEVPAGQREPCRIEMIEERLRPVGRRMTTLTFRAVVPHM